jgi:hypothetical protein
VYLHRTVENVTAGMDAQMRHRPFRRAREAVIFALCASALVGRFHESPAAAAVIEGTTGRGEAPFRLGAVSRRGRGLAASLRGFELMTHAPCEVCACVDAFAADA